MSKKLGEKRYLEKKQQIVFDVLSVIKTKMKDNKSFKPIKDNKSLEDLNLRVLSEKIHLFAIKKALKDTTDNSCSIEMLFHKAGILSFLYDVNEILRKDANYDFASNLKVSTKGRKKIRKMSDSELEKKAIQYDVALLSIYQEKVDEIMKGEIKIFDEEGKEIKFFDEEGKKIENNIDKLDAIDYEFIKLPLEMKILKEQDFKDELKSLETKENMDIPLSKEAKNRKIQIKRWQSLTTEEKAINDFLNSSDFASFRDNVMKKYSENLDFNEFLIKFGEVWKLNKENYVKRLFDNKRFDNADKRFIRKNNSDRTGFTDNDKEQHENLLASMHRVYITGVDKKGNLTKWGENDGKLLALLSKELVQHTKRVAVLVRDNKSKKDFIITHDDVCGSSSKTAKKKYSEQVWNEAVRQLHGKSGLFHTKLRDEINKSKTVGEVIFNVRRVFENPKLKLTKKCKNDFNRVLNEVLKDVKKENQQ